MIDTLTSNRVVYSYTFKIMNRKQMEESMYTRHHLHSMNIAQRNNCVIPNGSSCVD